MAALATLSLKPTPGIPVQDLASRDSVEKALEVRKRASVACFDDLWSGLRDCGAVVEQEYLRPDCPLFRPYSENKTCPMNAFMSSPFVDR